MKNQLSKLNLEVAQLLKDPKVSDAIDQYKLNKVNRASQEKTIPSATAVQLRQNEATLAALPSKTAATIAKNKFATETAQASSKLLPARTANEERNLTALDTQRKITDEVVAQLGGIEGMARRQVEDAKLKTEATRQEIENKKVLANYYENVGLAKKLEAVGKLNPSLKQQLGPLSEMQSELLSTKVKVPGEGQTRIPLSEYLELNKEDDTKYPLNNIAEKLLGILQSTDRQMEGVLSEQLVDVYVPDETTSQPTEGTTPATPAYQQALNRAKQNTQSEYMNTPGVGGAGFPFMP